MDVVGPQDIPAGADVQVQHNFNNTNVGPPEPLFAFQTSEYVGQPLGLVLATSITAAREGAAAVTAQYAAYDSSNGGGIDPSSSLHNDWAQAPNGGSAKHNPNGVERRPSGPLASLDAAAAAGSWYNMGGLTASLSASKGAALKPGHLERAGV
jgi:phage tail tape-measure protein